MHKIGGYKMALKAKDLKNQGIKLKLKGMEVEIKCNLNTFCELENIYNSPDEVFSALAKGSFTAIRGVIWANLKRENPYITPEEVGELIDFNDITEISDVIIKSIDNSMPDIKETDQTEGE
jgi:hypothetical protein